MKKMRFAKLRVALLALMGALLFACWAVAPCDALRYNLLGHIFNPKGDTKSLQYPLGRVWPYKKNSLICYYLSDKIFTRGSRGVGIGVGGSHVIDVDLPPDLYFQNQKYYGELGLAHPFEERVSLYIDDALVSNSTKRVYKYGVAVKYFEEGTDRSGYYDITWFPDLSLGKHKAKLIVETLPGKIIEYEWEFTITLW